VKFPSTASHKSLKNLIKAPALWDFMAGRGGQEKTFAELKGQWALDVVPPRHYSANSAWQQIAILGHDLLRNFQLQTVATKKQRSRKELIVALTAKS
jgi:predicted metal-dependent phosphoesterase TrpH